MLVNFYQTTQQYNPEDNHLPVQRWFFKCVIYIASSG
jgi:hypothetical protein